MQQEKPESLCEKKLPHVLKYLQQGHVYIFVWKNGYYYLLLLLLLCLAYCHYWLCATLVVNKDEYKIVSFIKLDRFQPFKLWNTLYKLKTRSHVKAFIGVKIVFQFRNRCKLPTCAVGYHARYCWRRFSACWITSAWCVYALCTALIKFSPRIALILGISFLSFVKNSPSLQPFFTWWMQR